MQSWEKLDKYKEDKNAFIFSLDNQKFYKVAGP
jgi:hypothetical protein